MQDYKFRKAVPVWAEGREKEMNVWLAFTAKVDGEEEHGSRRHRLLATCCTASA